MEKTAIYRIPYGLYYLGARSGDRQNICVVNTVQQVTDAPQRISVTVLKSNLTCEMIAASRAFSAAILDMDSTMEDIAHFGQQSGRDTDKLANMKIETDALGNPVYAENCAAVLSAAVTERIDLGTHMLFVGEVKDAAVLTDKTPITYAEYRARKAGKAPLLQKRRKKRRFTSAAFVTMSMTAIFHSKSCRTIISVRSANSRRAFSSKCERK